MGQSPIPHYYHDGVVREEPGQTWGQAPIPLTILLWLDTAKRKTLQHAHPMRACVLWQTNYQRRVWGWQVLRSRHSGIALRRRCCAQHTGIVSCGRHRMCQHVLTEKLIVSPRATLTDYIILLDITPRAVGTARESMRPLANELPTARAGLKRSAAPSIGYRTAYGDSFVRHAHNVPVFAHSKNDDHPACGNNNFCIPAIRVCPPQESGIKRKRL